MIDLPLNITHEPLGRHREERTTAPVTVWTFGLQMAAQSGLKC